MHVKSVLASLVMALAVAMAQTQCGLTTCLTNQQCCGTTCFDPTSQACCGGQVYSPISATCCNNAKVCAAGQRGCCPPTDLGLSGPSDCSWLNVDNLQTELFQVVCGSNSACSIESPTGNAGFNNNVWASVVNKFGTVCAVLFSGQNLAGEMLAGRLTSASKAYTASAFSTPSLALSSANLYAQSQPGGIWWGSERTNPIDPATAYSGDQSAWGGPCNSTASTNQTVSGPDPLCGKVVGGMQMVGGGLALYSANGHLLGGLGVAGDTSCTDHIIAWRLRSGMSFDYIPVGVDPSGTDNIIYPATNPFGHPECSAAATTASQQLLTLYPVKTASPTTA